MRRVRVEYILALILYRYRAHLAIVILVNRRRVQLALLVHCIWDHVSLGGVGGALEF